MTLPHGLYDRVITESLARTLASLPDNRAQTAAIASTETPLRLLEVFSGQLQHILEDLEGEDSERALAQLTIVNDLILDLRARFADNSGYFDPVVSPPRVLTGVSAVTALDLVSPDTGLAVPWLFTAGKGSPALLSELLREASACDQIDILVSFITTSGVRKLAHVLGAITAANAHGDGRTRVRVLTTTYTGATEQAALDHLARLNGCEVKVSLDGRRTRLHAKAWIFHRRTGFGSAYVGSANLSGAALMGGLEWTVKFTQRGQEPLYERAKAHFATLWEDDEFRTYNPADATSREELAAALSRERGERTSGGASFFDIQPKQYQREMLAQLARERELGRTRNLVVAATGTGKTVVAALDYRDLVQRTGHKPRLLFVAHRAQILRQALRTYREVLRDHSFGVLLTGHDDPPHHDHLFATIDSLTSRGLVARLGADYWHTVVIDECHRIAANRFAALATGLRPASLLGLTATPERTDGAPIAQFFDMRPDMSPAVELRLWDALDMQLLAPFEYYAADDDTDLSTVPWNTLGEQTELERLLVGNSARARLVVDEWRRLSANLTGSRALAFCVSREHARFMAESFNKAGIPAEAVLGDTPDRDRIRAIHGLKRGELRVLVTVDLFNEGVDLPDVDTLLLLRPTQSALLFQQQIGRGLRLSPGKESCLILDFVGLHAVEFRFDRLLGGLTGLSRRALIDAVERGFSSLAPGCHIHLEPQTRTQVLRNLRSAANHRWNRLVTELRGYAAQHPAGTVALASFLHDQLLSLEDVYRESAPSGWTTLARSAGLLQGQAPAGEADFSRRLGDLLHEDDPRQLATIRRVAEMRATYQPSSQIDAVRAQMLTYQIDTSRSPLSYQDFCERLSSFPACANELVELSDILAAAQALDPQPIPGLPDIPLALHGAYRIREIQTAFGHMTATRRPLLREGVLAFKDQKLELFFVTLDKSSGYHERIAYHDYAVSPRLFHWQTQNSAGPDTTTGKRYVESLSNGWRFQLFVRTDKSAAYRACGPVRISGQDDITGDRPMNITWHLEVPLPTHLFREFSVLRS
ncbi:MAG: DUF3427 domain-containing protein [Gemmatimonadetes bacterium]|nr:DUF3427 domain-containing protein [Gemmatimonadota bacterium]